VLLLPPPPLIHGRKRWDPFQGRELGVYDGGGARDLPRARGPRVPHASGGIHGLLCGILRVRIWCAVAPIPLLTTTRALGNHARGLQVSGL
jgi:hypothetical protein